ncbi:MAG: type I glyceraldehyde-3-phosphate dehydrogenase, partial [Chitinivibrionales bacterium]|nr:type I glyceraldehyde-3-phosphate dehydrogenase [Chitinivibrionales bacterium]
MTRIAINGLGRIGRAVLKIAIDQPQIDVVAVNDLIPLDNLAYLLRYDSVYGKYGRQVRQEGDALYVGETKVQFLTIKDPAHLP